MGTFSSEMPVTLRQRGNMTANSPEIDPTAVFFEVHSHMPQEGPGLPQTTQRAFAMLTDLSPQPRILDMACGPGRQTADLAQLATATGGNVVALERHWPFLEQTRERVPAVSLVHGDMGTLCFAPHAFDVVWSEGAVYIIGFEDGLRLWRSLLKPGGYVAVTELSWLKPPATAPDEVRSFWEEAYPSIGTVAENESRLARAGYELVGQFTLPEAAWWAYYEPLQARITAVRRKYAANPAVAALLDEEEREISLYKQYADYFGYVFYIGQRR